MSVALNRKEEALWLFQRFAPTVAVDNLPLAIRCSADLDRPALEAAAAEVLRRHPALRTRFPARHGAPRREVVAPADAVAKVDAVAVGAADLDRTLTGLARRPFDLTRDLPLRVFGIDLHEGGSVVGLVSHHIAFDGASGGVVMPELADTYWQLHRGQLHRGPVQPGRPVLDPAVALTEPMPSAESLRYWLDALSGVDPGRLALSLARPEPPEPTFAGARLERDLSTRAQASVRDLRTRLRATDNMVLLAAYIALLARHGAGPDIVVGVPVNLRRGANAGAVGYHVSTLPLRVRVELDRGFDHLAASVRDRLVAGLDHADVSFESLLGELRLENTTWRTPLFRHMFNFLPPATVAAPGELPDARWVTVDPGTSRHDLQFVVLRTAGRIGLQAGYSTEVHDEGFVRALMGRYELLLAAAATDPSRPLHALDLWSEQERRVVHRANAAPSLPSPTIAALAGRRLGAIPGAEALIEADGREVSRHELARRAAGLRRDLVDAGVGRGDVVALSLPRGTDLAAAVLATWSVGAAYLPLDPAQPAARLADLLDRSGARAVVSDADLDVVGRAVVVPGGSTSDTEALQEGLAAVGAEELAYVIFTSGSTGRPKGVEVTHRNLANVVHHFAAELALSSTHRVLWLTTFGFDISALELNLALAHGAGLVVAPDEAQTRPELLVQLIERRDVAVVQATPTIWRLAAPACEGRLAGRTVLCGGEPLPAALAEKLVRTGGRVFNVYGPTETTIWSTSARITGEVVDPVGVGRPIAGTALHVVDEYGHDVPPGVVAELCVAGVGVARGYVGAPELTAQRFGADEARGRFYRTGDLATWTADGTITLLGRSDRQVKLRGRRIELGEIEAVLEQHPAVVAAATVVVGDPQGDGRLVAYLQPAEIDLDEVRRHARAALPHYLVPADLVALTALPRNPNGKVDYGALPAVARSVAVAPAEASDDPLVGRVLVLWREVLGRDDLGAASNFFADGGHSLLAAILAARLGEELELEVSLLDIFNAPTPVELVTLLRRSEVAS